MESNNNNLYLNTAKLLELRSTDYPAFIDLLYTTIVDNKYEAIADDYDRQEKEHALEILLEYYKKDEEYEKCAKLYEIQKIIRGDANAAEISGK